MEGREISGDWEERRHVVNAGYPESVPQAGQAGSPSQNEDKSNRQCCTPAVSESNISPKFNASSAGSLVEAKILSDHTGDHTFQMLQRPRTDSLHQV